MNLTQADRKKLLPLLDELSGAVEELLLTGLTTASEATRQSLGVAFQEASRLRLLRLGSTLRAAVDELGRFTRDEADFSRKRLSFFLNRAWLLGRGLARALRAGEAAAFDRLLRTPASVPVSRLEVVTLGVGKRVAAGAFCAFEFRLRSIQAMNGIPAGRPLVWSCVFPIKRGSDIPAEGFLHLPQKQKFTAHAFLEGKVVVIDNAAVAGDETSGRISLGDDSRVTLAGPYTEWDRFRAWDPAAALARVRAHRPGPFDLEVELQEEVVLDDWKPAKAEDRDGEGQVVYPIAAGPRTFDAVASRGPDGEALRAALDSLVKKKHRPPLFGLMHYERCRLVLQPLALFGKDGMEHVTLSREKVDRAALLKALKF